MTWGSRQTKARSAGFGVLALLWSAAPAGAEEAPATGAPALPSAAPVPADAGDVPADEAPADEAPAETSTDPAPADAAMSELELELPSPRVNLGSLGREASHRWWPNYAEHTEVPNLWRGVADPDLRLNVETGRWQLFEGLTLSTALVLTPERERLCSPACAGPGMSSSVRLKYDVADLAWLRQFGPVVEIVTNAQDAEASTRDAETPLGRSWMLRVGLGWSF